MMLSFSRWVAARGLTVAARRSAASASAALSALPSPFVSGPAATTSPPPPTRPFAAPCLRTKFGGSVFSAGGVVGGAAFSTTAAGSGASTDTPDAAAEATAAGTTKPPFSKILIANRGEIALRVIKTCKSLGISTVAVHSTVDGRSPHVLAADEAVCVGPAPSSQSYLDVDAVCRAIEQTGAEAVHPGYGFLSENAEFAKRVSDMGVKFIGPSSSAIVAMGDKIQSKKLAREAGVNVIPGFDGVIKSPEEAVKIAEDIGYPVMIKATAGGGGKGMRICHNPEQVKEGYHLSTAEAKSFFGDERLFIERYIENPHHIEIQVLAGRRRKKRPKTSPVMNPFPFLDGKEYGPLEILCFPERECSIQRRNQKIIEESPSTLLTPETRAAMVRQVKSLVRKVEYHSAGTVEFLVDESQRFFFLEMNTRLQVEHPVTEMVSGGVDLVRGMIDVAGGRGVPDDYLALVGQGGEEKCGAKEADDDDGSTQQPSDDEEGRVVPHVGHAIEARIYAEDPLNGFLPSIGPLLSYVEPPCIAHSPLTDPAEDAPTAADDDKSGCVIRCDSGVRAGSLISQYYDPMISKLIAYSPRSRDDAINALGRALDRYVIVGVRHNASFASDVLRHPEFVAGRTPTNFIETHYSGGFHGVALTEGEREELAAIGAAIGVARMRARAAAPLPLGEEEGGATVVCLGGMFGEAYRVNIMLGDGDGAPVAEVLKLPPRSSEGEAAIADGDGAEQSPPWHVSRSVSISLPFFDPISPVLEPVVEGAARAIQVGPEDNSGAFSVRMYGADVPILLMSPGEYELSLKMREIQAVDTSDLILSPMPGTLISYAVEEGAHVEVGQEICVVEAMKMQNIIRSERAGVVARLRTQIGASLKADEVIVEYEKEVIEEKEGKAA